jgi:hypothetical protein
MTLESFGKKPRPAKSAAKILSGVVYRLESLDDLDEFVRQVAAYVTGEQ